MKAIQTYFREQDREPTDVELETLAQTWSEHCSTRRSRARWTSRCDDETARRLDAAVRQPDQGDDLRSTMELMGRHDERPDFCLSASSRTTPAWSRSTRRTRVCFKVETHNHPCAIEPYGGANTGLGGVIRDVLGTGLGAKPIATPTSSASRRPDDAADRTQLPQGVLHPKRVLQQVVAGVRDYGNRMGIPTVNGAVSSTTATSATRWSSAAPSA